MDLHSLKHRRRIKGWCVLLYGILLQCQLVKNKKNKKTPQSDFFNHTDILQYVNLEYRMSTVLHKMFSVLGEGGKAGTVVVWPANLVYFNNVLLSTL